MKHYIEKILAVILVLIATNAVAEDNNFHVKWGLENPYFYSELKATKRQNAAMWPPVENGEVLYRYFTIREHDSTFWRKAEPLFSRHHKLWNQYQSQQKKPNREDYLRFVRSQDPFFAGSIKEMAPVLFFDFIGIGAKEYVLDSIEVNTVDFEEYAGGGFFDKAAWYDIVLSTRAGIKRYEVDKKLRFNGSGRAELRFWSDNYYPTMGMAPMGCFTIDITFHFLVDGKRESVTTGVFKIDV